jgi:hypothetical protein
MQLAVTVDEPFGAIEAGVAVKVQLGAATVTVTELEELPVPAALVPVTA